MTAFKSEVKYQIGRADEASTVNYYFEAARKGEPLTLGIRQVTPRAKLIVHPHLGTSWVGEFEGGSEGLTGIFSTPNEQAVCVVTAGQGFWVPVCSPENFDIIRSFPIKEIRQITEKDIIIFIDYTTIAAYGPNGFIWATEELSWDGLRKISILEDRIIGEGWDSPADRFIPFSVDLTTGRATGGSSPAKFGVRSRTRGV